MGESVQKIEIVNLNLFLKDFEFNASVILIFSQLFTVAYNFHSKVWEKLSLKFRTGSECLLVCVFHQYNSHERYLVHFPKGINTV